MATSSSVYSKTTLEMTGGNCACYRVNSYYMFRHPHILRFLYYSIPQNLDFRKLRFAGIRGTQPLPSIVDCAYEAICRSIFNQINEKLSKTYYKLAGMTHTHC